MKRQFIIIDVVQPRVTIGPGVRELYDNEEISFRCVGDGFPTPSIQVHTLTLLPVISWCVF